MSTSFDSSHHAKRDRSSGEPLTSWRWGWRRRPKLLLDPSMSIPHDCGSSARPGRYGTVHHVQSNLYLAHTA